MNNIIWKGFTLGELFCFDSSNQYPFTQKQVDIVYDKDEEHDIAVIAQSAQNNGVIGYISRNESTEKYVCKDSMTFSMNFGICFYHQYDYLLLDTHGSIFRLIARNENFAKFVINKLELNLYLAKIINKICFKSLYDWQWKPNSQRASRELILLPCLEVEKDDEYIWEENGHYYTLAVKYINHLMDEAKELCEQKTIRLYEAERAKYEAGYKMECSVLVWKGFTLRELFNFDSSNQLSLNKKALNVNNEASAEFSIALITQSEKNNGISGYLEETDEIKNKKMRGFLTYSMHFGLCFYHNYDFVLMDTHGSVFRLIPHNTILNSLLCKYEYLNYFLGRTITNVCKNGIYNYNWLPNSTRVARELILLPCVEVEKDDEYIWEENDHYYTLAVKYISYIYLTGKINNSQKKIDNYTYRY
ncbi:MAG: hypothetical protein ACTTID_04070 [Bacillales bacterium]